MLVVVEKDALNSLLDLDTTTTKQRNFDKLKIYSELIFIEQSIDKFHRKSETNNQNYFYLSAFLQMFVSKIEKFMSVASFFKQLSLFENKIFRCYEQFFIELPITSYRREIKDFLQEKKIGVLKAPFGFGKTTEVPFIMLELMSDTFLDGKSDKIEFYKKLSQKGEKAFTQDLLPNTIYNTRTLHIVYSIANSRFSSLSWYIKKRFK